MIPNGWLYNVTGLEAVELKFKNRKSVVRIGTDKPVEVSRSINELIKSGIDYELAPEKKDYSGYFLSAVLIFFSLFIPAILIIAGSRETGVNTTGSTLEINGVYGITIRYSDIVKLDTLTILPGIKRKTNGYAFRKTMKGNFRMADGSMVRLFIKAGSVPYLKITTKEHTIYLNFGDKSLTRELYMKMRTSVSHSPME